MQPTSELLTLALQLPEQERAAMAHQLLLSLEPEPADPDCEQRWAEELERRMQKVAAGQFKASDWREALDRIRQALEHEAGS